jgi:hypothetical protein
MQREIIVFALGMLAAEWAVASERTDVVAVLKGWTDRFNKGDFR